jgi:fatty-acid desaturase
MTMTMMMMMMLMTRTTTTTMMMMIIIIIIINEFRVTHWLHRIAENNSYILKSIS